ncbi:hypothetical protein ElyMa_003389100 [Elysia marginata]|uniref:MAM domain-containing protein n=1 Tax=Elysia marginata TaxID=1093978 RepID=A0AAV4JL05_9GAST|nr:hypothetical protein ElyMa_003389100 [Elysia marginata]
MSSDYRYCPILILWMDGACGDSSDDSSGDSSGDSNCYPRWLQQRCTSSEQPTGPEGEAGYWQLSVRTAGPASQDSGGRRLGPRVDE